MDVFEAIARRYSYRGKLIDRPVPREDLQKIVQAGQQKEKLPFGKRAWFNRYGGP